MHVGLKSLGRVGQLAGKGDLVKVSNSEWPELELNVAQLSEAVRKEGSRV